MLQKPSNYEAGSPETLQKPSNYEAGPPPLSLGDHTMGGAVDRRRTDAYIQTYFWAFSIKFHEVWGIGVLVEFMSTMGQGILPWTDKRAMFLLPRGYGWSFCSCHQKIPLKVVETVGKSGHSRKQSGNSRKQSGNSRETVGNSRETVGNSRKQSENSRKQSGNSRETVGNSWETVGNSRKQSGNSRKQSETVGNSWETVGK